MNPWEEAPQLSLSNPTSPVIETFQAIQQFEKERKEGSVSSYRRNDAYWMELKNIHAESLIDLTDFVEYLNNKKESYRKQGIAVRPTPNGSKSSKSSGVRTSCKSSDDAVKKSLNQGAGMQTRKALEEFDQSMSTKFTEEAEFLEKDLIRNFVAQVESMETELKSLWLRGDRLLYAVKLSDYRAKKNYESYCNLVSTQTKQSSEVSHTADVSNADSTNDIWLAEVCYSVAAARSYEVKDECNKQLKFLFARAKEFENRRRSSIAKAGGEKSPNRMARQIFHLSSLTHTRTT
jgi:predicted DNA-binding ribbon-helix-helix protein